MTQPAPAPASRTGLAATALGLPHASFSRSELATAVCAFRGRPAPGPGLAAQLVDRVFTALDQVPLDVRLYVHDLQDTAEKWPALPITFPVKFFCSVLGLTAGPWDAARPPHRDDAAASLAVGLSGGG